MALDLNLVGIDRKKAAQGIRVPLSRGGEVRLYKWNNPAMRRLQTQLYQEYRRLRPGKKRIVGSNVPPEVIEEVQLEVVVETILAEWYDFKNGREEFPYSKENARALLSNEDYRWILDEIVEASQAEELWQEEQKAADLGNSVGSSDGA